MGGVADGISSSWLDGRHVVFGEVISGMDIVLAIENVETDNFDRPVAEVKIVKSGELKDEEEEPSAPTGDKAQEEEGKETGKQEL